MLHLFLTPVPVWISIRVCAVGLPLKEAPSKVELLSVLLVQAVLLFIILERQTLQAQGKILDI